MRFLSLAVVGISSLLPLAASQDLSSLPSCAVSCATNAIGATGCALTDAHCICTATSFLSSVQSCISTACSPSDQQATLQFAVQFCGQAGVTITLPTASATSAAGPTFTPSSSGPAATPAVTTSYTPASYTPASASPAATYTGAAAPVHVQQWAAVAGVVGLGVAAVL